MNGRELLGTEGPVFSFLDKVGQLIVLSLVWILGCVPLVTVVTSTTALYYAVIKSVRREYGSALGEFWSSYKANLKRGIPITVVLAILCWLLSSNVYLLTQPEQGNNFLLWGSVVLLVLLAGVAAFICPVLSRFSMGAWQACRLAFVMAIRYWYFTLALVLGTAALAALQIFVLPMASVLLVPSIWCYGTTYMVEKALRHFMPPKEENDDSWYYL